MKSSIIIITGITIIIVILVFSFPHRKWEDGLVSPFFGIIQRSSSSAVPSASPSPRVKIFQFDSATDLKKELDTVNPEVLDSDFNE